MSVTLDNSEIENKYEEIKILNSDGSGSSENVEEGNKHRNLMKRTKEMESEMPKKKQKKMKLLDDNQDQSVDEDPWKKPFKIWKTKNGKGW